MSNVVDRLKNVMTRVTLLAVALLVAQVALGAVDGWTATPPARPTTLLHKATQGTLSDGERDELRGTAKGLLQNAETGAANFATAQTTVTASATPLVSARAFRRALIVVNHDASITMYVGASDVATNSGLRLKAGESATLKVTGAVYAIAESGTPTVSTLEEYD